jgi:hypothetical protein
MKDENTILLKKYLVIFLNFINVREIARRKNVHLG